MGVYTYCIEKILSTYDINNRKRYLLTNLLTKSLVGIIFEI
jgi:hypothetical protein